LSLKQDASMAAASSLHLAFPADELAGKPRCFSSTPGIALACKAFADFSQVFAQ